MSEELAALAEALGLDELEEDATELVVEDHGLEALPDGLGALKQALRPLPALVSQMALKHTTSSLMPHEHQQHDSLISAAAAAAAAVAAIACA